MSTTNKTSMTPLGLNVSSINFEKAMDKSIES